MSERRWCERCRGWITQTDDGWCCGGHYLLSFEDDLERARFAALPREERVRQTWLRVLRGETS